MLLMMMAAIAADEYGKDDNNVDDVGAAGDIE